MPTVATTAREGPGSVPLTVAQRIRLAAGCLPLLFWGALSVIAFEHRGSIPGSRPVILSILGVLTLAFAVQAARRIHDLVSGVAAVRVDRLERAISGRTYTGRFDELGTMRLTARAYTAGVRGNRYRVCYSPASRIVWNLEHADRWLK
jgi:hypothetical protein